MKDTSPVLLVSSRALELKSFEALELEAFELFSNRALDMFRGGKLRRILIKSAEI